MELSGKKVSKLNNINSASYNSNEIISLIELILFINLLLKKQINFSLLHISMAIYTITFSDTIHV